ncbi:uroporphyrinogen-III C-methyltransferase [Chelatococcus daeguensis]|uniref:uroporphyrinogen-III C-methyltransferase n=1 Tax=Chelatococcus daeguensis TaxID=444444 RepID=UPI0007ABA97A|nr:uroporphyrinogen-III C-methyltransferase [Chelatococcus daeguensis]KZE30682.1 uroporphyrin-III methyltransferase [Chelatococcus daeguensis]MBM3082050.1 uroporphyrinogen-III C-methyltransferase [Chelatococcus daeguensis]
MRLPEIETPAFAPGSVWLVGAGPGDPGLLTLHAVKALVEADVIVHDALVDPRILALAPSSARREYAGKRGGKPSACQRDISERLVALAREGLRVLRLKGGDPFVFGRGGEEVLALAAAGVPFHVVPGLSSGIAALAAHALPATTRDTNHAVILATGHAAPGEEGADWAALARAGVPIVLYMAVANLPAIVTGLKAGGMPGATLALAVERVSTLDERLVEGTLDELAALAAGGGLNAPAVIAVGAIARFRAMLAARLKEAS